MLTPLKKSFEDYPREKSEVQEELTEIRSSVYKDFVYFPYNTDLIKLTEEQIDSE